MKLRSTCALVVDGVPVAADCCFEVPDADAPFLCEQGWAKPEKAKRKNKKPEDKSEGASE